MSLRGALHGEHKAWTITVTGVDHILYHSIVIGYHSVVLKYRKKGKYNVYIRLHNILNYIICTSLHIGGIIYVILFASFNFDGTVQHKIKGVNFWRMNFSFRCSTTATLENVCNWMAKACQ